MASIRFAGLQSLYRKVKLSGFRLENSHKYSTPCINQVSGPAVGPELH